MSENSRRDYLAVEAIEDRRPKAMEAAAAAYREEASELLASIIALMRKAEREDFRIEFNIGRDQAGVPFFSSLAIVKRF